MSLRKKHAVKMCIYSPFDYVLDFNLSISVSSYFSRTALSPETAIFHLVCKKLVISSTSFQSQNDLQTERRVSSNLSDMVSSVEIVLFLRTKMTYLLRG